MDEIGLDFGRPMFIEEITKTTVQECRSVSVIGRLTDHDVDECTALLMDPQSKQILLVSTSLIEPFGAKFGSLFQMIGELEVQEGRDVVLLCARVVRCVDGMDTGLYRKALHCQRTYLSSRQ